MQLLFDVLILLLSRYLSLSSVNKQGTIDCHSISNINQEHKRICKNQPEVMRTVGRGIKVAIDECQRQFFRERWNCPVMESSSPHSVFGPTLDRGNWNFCGNISVISELTCCYAHIIFYSNQSENDSRLGLSI